MEFQNRFDKYVWNSKGCWQEILEFQNNSEKKKNVWNSNTL